MRGPTITHGKNSGVETSSDSALVASPTLQELLPVVYDELRHLAQRIMRYERSSHTLDPTALVHETYLKLRAHRNLAFEDQNHFVAIAARAMRQVLVGHAEARAAAKRGGGWGRLDLDHVVMLFEDRVADVVALDEALRRLGGIDPDAVRLVELRFFGGLDMSECATVLTTSKRTVEREWALARAWLRRELASTDSTTEEARENRPLEKRQSTVSRSA